VRRESDVSHISLGDVGCHRATNSPVRQRKGWTLDRIETRVTRDAGEGKISTIELELLLGGDVSDEQRQRLAEIATRCPIHRTLSEILTITHH